MIKNKLKILAVLGFSLFFGVEKLLAKAVYIERPCAIYQNKEDGTFKKVSEGKVGESFEFLGFKKSKSRSYIYFKDKNPSADPSTQLSINKDCAHVVLEKNDTLTQKFPEDPGKFLSNLSDFDKVMLNFCGVFGSHPDRHKFQMMLKMQFPSELKELQEEWNKGLSTPISSEEFLSRFTDLLWYDHGLEHVVCGIPGINNVSGPHYYPRFIELQKLGLLGTSNLENDSCKSTRRDIDSGGMLPDIVNEAVTFQTFDGSLYPKCQNSFSKTWVSKDLLKLAINIDKIKAAASNNNISRDTRAKDSNLAKESKKTNNKPIDGNCLFKGEEKCVRMVYKTHSKKNGEKFNSLVTFYPLELAKCSTENISKENMCQLSR